MRKIIFILLSVLLLASCNTQKVVTETPKEEPKTIIIDSLKEKVFANIYPTYAFEHIKIKGNVDAKLSDNNTPTINSVIYVEKNKKIWINGSILLLNVVRGLITPNAVKGYEKVNKTFIDSDFSALNSILGIDFLDYKNTENLLLGRVFVPVEKANYKVEIINKNYVLTSVKDIVINQGKVKGSYKNVIELDEYFLPNKVTLIDTKQNKSWEISYYDKAKFQNIIFPKKVKILIKDTKSKEIYLEYNTFEFTKIETPFSIPSNYTKRDL